MQARFVFHLLLIGAFAAPAALFPSHLIAQSADRAAQLLGELDVPEADTPVREHPGWRPPVRVLVGGGGATPERLAELQAVAPGVEIVPIRPGQAAQEAVATADALIGTCHPALLEAGTSLRWVQAFGAGVEDCLASPFIGERGILLTNVQRVLAPAMAEHVMALALSLARQLPAYRDHQRDGLWRRAGGPEVTLQGRTMLVVGLGGVGTEVAERAHAFGMTVTAIRNSDRPGPPTVSRVGQSAALHDFLREADVVVNTLPLTDETRHMFDARAFAAMKPGAWFINVGRGATVVTADLTQALEAGHVGAAALDVTDPEPLPSDHPLWRMPNVIITPHVAPNSEVNIDSRWALFRENLRRYVAGEPMLSVVDTSRGY